MSPFGNLTLPVTTSLRRLSGHFDGSNGSGSDQSISPIVPATQFQRTIDYAVTGTDTADVWISPAPEEIRRPHIIGTLGSNLKPGSLCTVWPLIDFKMRQHPSMEAAQMAAASQSTSAWYAGGLAYTAPIPELADTRNINREEVQITERPWEDARRHPEEDPPARKSLFIEERGSIKGADSDNSDEASSHAAEKRPNQSFSSEKSPWEESFAISTKESPGPRASAFGHFPYENSSDAWK